MKKLVQKILALTLAMAMIIGNFAGTGVSIVHAGEEYTSLIIKLMNGNTPVANETVVLECEDSFYDDIQLTTDDYGKVELMLESYKYDSFYGEISTENYYDLKLTAASEYTLSNESIVIGFDAEETEDGGYYYLDSVEVDGTKLSSNELTVNVVKPNQSDPVINSVSSKGQVSNNGENGLNITVTGSDLPTTFYVTRKTDKGDVYSANTTINAVVGGTSDSRMISIDIPAISKMSSQDATKWIVTVKCSDTEEKSCELIIMDGNVKVETKQALQKEIDTANSKINSQEYTEESCEQLKSAIAQATGLNVNDDDAQSKYEAVITAIQSVTLVRIDAPKEETLVQLNEDIKEYDTLEANKNKYTPTSWSTYKEAVEAGKALLNQETYYTESDCQDAISSIKTAKDGLKEINAKALNVTIKGSNIVDTVLCLKSGNPDFEDVVLEKTSDGRVSYECASTLSVDDVYYLQPSENVDYCTSNPVEVRFAKDDKGSVYVDTVNDEPYTGNIDLEIKAIKINGVSVEEGTVVSGTGAKVKVTITGENLPDSFYVIRNFKRDDQVSDMGTLDNEALKITAEEGGSETSRTILVQLPSVYEQTTSAISWIIRVNTRKSGNYAQTSAIPIQKLSQIVLAKNSEDGKVDVKLSGYDMSDTIYYKLYYQYASEGKTVDVFYGDAGECKDANATEKAFTVTLPTDTEIDGHKVIGWGVAADFEDAEKGGYPVKSSVVATSVAKEIGIKVIDIDTNEPVPNLALGITCTGSCAPYYFTSGADGTATVTVTGGNATFTLEPNTDEYTCKVSDDKNTATTIVIAKDALNTSYVKTVNGSAFSGETVILQVKNQDKVKVETKNSLTELLEETTKLKKDDYTEESWKAYSAAVEAGNALAVDATNAEYLAAIQAIKDAKAALKKASEVTPEPTVSVTKITISGISKKIAVGKKIQLTAKVVPSNATNKAVKWTSSNTKYAKVTSTGKVTLYAKGAGKTVTIKATATDGSGKTATYKIKIMKNAVKSIKLKASSKSVKAGKSVTVKATVKTTGSKVNKTLKWTSSNAKYATVNSKGKVTAKKAGKGKTVKITAAATDGSGKKATVKIKIK